MDSQRPPQFFDEMAKLATGAVSAFQGFREHIQGEVKSHMNKFVAEMDFVPREDFEIVEAMAKKARNENESLKKRVEALEKKLGATAKKAPAKKATPKTAKKTAKKK